MNIKVMVMENFEDGKKIRVSKKGHNNLSFLFSSFGLLCKMSSERNVVVLLSSVTPPSSVKLTVC